MSGVLVDHDLFVNSELNGRGPFPISTGCVRILWIARGICNLVKLYAIAVLELGFRFMQHVMPGAWRRECQGTRSY